MHCIWSITCRQFSVVFTISATRLVSYAADELDEDEAEGDEEEEEEKLSKSDEESPARQEVISTDK